MPEPTLIRSQTLVRLHTDHSPTLPSVHFEQDVEEDFEDWPLYVEVDVNRWREMGEPAVLTVTIEPRDTLNGSD